MSSTRSPQCGCGETCACVDCNGGHAYCKCGEHCSCNPCNCSKIDETASGKSFCKCGENCACETCTCSRAGI